MRRTMVRLPLLAFVTAAALFGQQPLYTLKVDVPWVTVDVTVTDPSGKTVSDLKVEDFQVFENGELQRLDAQLQLGQVSDVLEVKAETAQLQTEDAKISTAVENKMVDELPLVVGGALRSPFDLVSTVPEAIAMSHMGIPVLGISCITNMAAGILKQKQSHTEVMETSARVQKQFTELVLGVLGRL